jgi:hypothetical protein
MKHVCLLTMLVLIMPSLNGNALNGAARADEAKKTDQIQKRARKIKRKRKRPRNQRRRRHKGARIKLKSPSIKKRINSKRRAPLRRPGKQKRINPYFLFSERNYPGQVNGYLPGQKKKSVIHFTARNGLAYFEGDILLGPSQGVAQRLAKTSRKKRGGRGAVQSNIDYLWPQGRIPYLIDTPLHKYTRTMSDIRAAIVELNQRTHLNLVPWSNEDNYVKIVMDDGCSSWVGMQGGMQEINIAPWRKRSQSYCGQGAIIHEFLHAAGFWHTQSRADRRDYVTVNMSNVDVNHRHNFARRNNHYQDWWYGVGAKVIGTYETSSIMHYGSGYFALDYWGCVGDDQKGGDLSKCSVVTKDGEFIPAEVELTTNDIRLINRLYPSNTAQNQELELLKRHCKLAIRKFCRRADPLVTCLQEAKRKKAKAYPGEPFGDGTACRNQLQSLSQPATRSHSVYITPSSEPVSADLVKLRQYCRRTVRRYCRTAKDTFACLIKTKATRARKYPKKVFGDSNRCRAQLKKMTP